MVALGTVGPSPFARAGRPGRMTIAAWCLLVLLPGPFRARPVEAQTGLIIPRSGDQWVVRRYQGRVTVSVTVPAEPRTGEYPLWVFTADADSGRTNQWVDLYLPLSNCGLPPLPLEAAGRWSWGWYVRNRATADYAAIQLITQDTTSLSLGASHNLYDNDVRLVPHPPDQYQEETSTLRDALVEANQRDEVPLQFKGPIVGISLFLQIPVRQQVWLGPIRYEPGPALAADPAPPPPSRGPRPGIFVLADLDGDGQVEVVTPWFTNNKVWRYDSRAGAFQEVARNDALSRYGPLGPTCAADLDLDGDLDLVGVEPDQAHVRILRRTVSGFVAETVAIPPPNPSAELTAIALGDDDHDGYPELFLGYQKVETQRPTPCISRMAGLPGGRFGSPVGIPAAIVGRQLDGTYRLTLVDLDNDGNLDLITAAGGCGVDVFPGTGKGTYGPPVEAINFTCEGTRHGFFRDLTLCDFNGDGRPDMFVCMLSQDANERGRCFLGINEGGFRFTECATQFGLKGAEENVDACVGDIDGRPGLELVVLESTRIVSYDLAGLHAESRGGRIGPVPNRVITNQASVVLDARMISLQDLDGDGRAELILSRDSGPAILRLPDSGPSWRLDVGGPGPSARRVGSRIEACSGLWSVPLEVNHRSGSAPLLIAAAESVRVRDADGSLSPPISARAGAHRRVDLTRISDPGALHSLTRLIRWRSSLALEYAAWFWRNEWGKGILLGGLLGLGGVLLTMKQRRAQERATEAGWLRLLQLVGISTHAAWRPKIANAALVLRQAMQSVGGSTGRVADTAGPVMAARELLPREFLNSLEETMTTAAGLNIEGTGAARESIRALATIHETAAPDWARLHGSARTLDARLQLVQELLAERFRCDAAEVCERAIHFQQRDTSGVDTKFQSDTPELSGRFPMRADDLFHCVDELLTNALKKQPRPRHIRISAGQAGPRTVFLRVWDDGADAAREGQRTDRAGDRLGLARMATLLGYYGGKVSVQDAEAGGVTAEVRLPRFDLV